MRKPHWMKTSEYEAFIRSLDDPIACRCGSMDDLTIDHIVPRAAGGLDVAENFQVLCRPCNSKKGANLEEFFNYSYWDDDENDPVKLDAMRRFQQVVFDTVFHCNRDWFTRPRFEIARVLYLIFGVMGAGKTIAIPAAAWAYNHLIVEHYGPYAPRAQCILVLTKSTDLRDQIVEELGGDPARNIPSDIVYRKIRKAKPRVLNAERWADLCRPKVVDDYDIAVMCVQNFWEGDGAIDRNVVPVLDRFPLIFLDEPHFGVGQVRGILQNATRSLVFGLTGTPFDADVAMFDDFALLCHYGYDDLVRDDNCLRFVNPAISYREVGIEHASIQEGENLARVSNADDPRYERAAEDSRLAPAMSVAVAVIDWLKRVEAGMTNPARQLAPHRRLASDRPDLVFPPHAILKVDSHETGLQLKADLQAYFAAHREEFPREDGWEVDYVYGANPKGKQSDKGNALSPDHPWKMYHRLRVKERIEASGRKKVFFQRLLIVNQLGQEGVNCWPCCTAGICCRITSGVTVAQLVLGRCLRSPGITDQETGIRSVPCSEADTVTIISHAKFNNQILAEQGCHFLLSSGDYAAQFRSMEDLSDSEGCEEEKRIPGPDVSLTDAEKMALVAGMSQGKHIPPDDIVSGVPGNDMWPAAKKRRASEWVKTATEDIKKAARELIVPDLPPMAAIRFEVPTQDPSDQELVSWINSRKPAYCGLIKGLADPDLGPGIRLVLKDVYNQSLRGIRPVFNPRYKMSDILGQIARDVERSFAACPEKPDYGHIRGTTTNVVKALLGVPEGAILANGGDWDSPPYHLALLDPFRRGKIVKRARYRLLQKGVWPEAARGLGVPDEEP